MGEMFGFEFPDDLTLLELVGVERPQSDVGIWQYVITDRYNATLVLYFNTIEGYFRTVVSINGEAHYRVSQDGVWTLNLLFSGHGTGLRAESQYERRYTEVDIFWEPRIQVEWRSRII